MLKTTKIIEIRSKDGASLKIDTRALKPGPRLQAAFDHLVSGGKLDELDVRDRAALAKKKSLIGRGANALIVRFDLKVIRIDEKLPIDMSKLTRSRRIAKTRSRPKAKR